MDYVRIYTDNPSPKEIERVAAVLRDGGIIVYPCLLYTSDAADEL